MITLKTVSRSQNTLSDSSVVDTRESSVGPFHVHFHRRVKTSIAASSCSVKQPSSTCSKSYNFHVARIIGGRISGVKILQQYFGLEEGGGRISGEGVLSGTYGICNA